MTSPARIGLIGAGWWATSFHLPALARHPHAELVAIADVDAQRAETAARRAGGAASFTDHRALLELGVDGVVIATPHDTRLARDRGRRLHVGYPFPYTRHSQALRQLVQDGDLGEVLTATSLFATALLPLYQGVIGTRMDVNENTLWPTGRNTYSDPRHGGGQLLTQVTHCASLLLYLSGHRPRTVFAQSGMYGTRVDVWNGIVFKTDTGAVTSIASTGTVGQQEHRVEEYRLFGSAGHALLDTRAGTLRVEFNDGRTLEPPPLDADEIYPAHAPAERLVDALVAGKPVLVPGELGLLTVELLAAAEASSRTDRPVILDLDETLLTPTTSGRHP